MARTSQIALGFTLFFVGVPHACAQDDLCHRFYPPAVSPSGPWTITSATSGGDGWPNCAVRHGDFEVWFPTDRILKAHPGAVRSVRAVRMKMLGCSDWKNYLFEAVVLELPDDARATLERCLTN
jgi:hypothetical protein